MHKFSWSLFIVMSLTLLSLASCAGLEASSPGTPETTIEQDSPQTPDTTEIQMPPFPESSVPTSEQLADVADWALAKGLIKDTLPVERMVDDSYLP